MVSVCAPQSDDMMVDVCIPQCVALRQVCVYLSGMLWWLMCVCVCVPQSDAMMVDVCIPQCVALMVDVCKPQWDVMVHVVI